MSDDVQALLKSQDIPEELIYPEMTFRQYTELAVYAKRLKLLLEDLRPTVNLTIKDILHSTLPSYYLERKLASVQRKAERVSDSDLGDRYVAPLVFYTDAIEVDKRTYEFLNQIRRSEPRLSALMGFFFRTLDYGKIPELLEEKFKKDDVNLAVGFANRGDDQIR